MAPGCSSRRQRRSSPEATNTNSLEIAEPFTPHTASSSVGSPSSSRKRGPSIGKALNKLIRLLGGKINLIIPEGVNRPVGEHHEKLTREIGKVIRQHAPFKVSGWAKIGVNDKKDLVERLKDKFNLDEDVPAVNKCLNLLLNLRYKGFRHLCHKHYIKLGKGELARRNPPREFADRLEDWEWLCDHWDSDSFQKRSRAGSTNRAKLKYVHKTGTISFAAKKHQLRCGEIDLYKACYHGKKGWASEEAESRYEQMITLQSEYGPDSSIPLSEAEIRGKVIGERSGYIPGEGYGPKPPLKRDVSWSASSQPQSKLLEDLEVAQSLLLTQQAQIESQKIELESQKVALEEQKLAMEAQQTHMAMQDKKMEWMEKALRQFLSAQTSSTCNNELS